MKQKLRVWWIPQVPMEAFYIPVDTPEEGKKILDILAAYDAFQLQTGVKPNYCNTGGLEMFDEEIGEWCGWYLETEDDYFEDVDEYISSTDKSEESEKFTKELFKQINWNKIKTITG